MTITEIPQRYLLPGVANTHPSIARWRDENWMAYRHEPGPFNKGTRVAITKCDKDWNPICGQSRILDIPLVEIDGGDKVAEDPRLLPVSGHDNLTCGPLIVSASNRATVGVGYCDGNSVYGFEWLKIPYSKPIEKNWGFFEYRCKAFGIRYVYYPTIYKLGDHFELSEKPDYDNVITWQWPWGLVRGGTNPVRYNDLFIGFFHSFTMGFPRPDGTVEAREQQSTSDVKVYYAAPYAFEATPPFRMRFVPTRPLIWPEIRLPEDRSPNGHYVVFPCGLIRDGDRWTMTYGDDRRMFKCLLTTEEIFDVLKPL